MKIYIRRNSSFKAQTLQDATSILLCDCQLTIHIIRIWLVLNYVQLNYY